MADFQKATERFFFTGVSCFPADALADGKLPYVKNVRVYKDGAIDVRSGLETRQTVGAAVHSLDRLNDPTTFNGGVPAVRIIGAGGNLYVGVPSNGGPGVLDGGYSGNPLTLFSAQPPNSPRPWEYVADSNQYRKFLTDQGAVAVGLAQPGPITSEPQPAMQVQHISAADIMTTTAWVAAGVVASGVGIGDRISTTIGQILYDSGDTGYASIVPASMDNITTGMLVTVGPTPGGPFENALITELLIPVTPTEVEAIVYDAGNTGLCTVQPKGSLGVGQLEAPSVAVYQARAIREAYDRLAPKKRLKAMQYLSDAFLPELTDGDAPTRRIRQVDFPVNCLIVMGGETVRILSVAVGPDGVQSFRCSTSGTVGSGDSIVGVASFRCFLSSTWGPGTALLRQQYFNTLTYPMPLDEDTQVVMTGGIQGFSNNDLSLFSNGQAVLPDDELHVAVNIDRLEEVVSVRVYIDVNSGPSKFLENYYFHEWRASDIISAIQSTNAANVTPLVDARRTVVANAQLDMLNSVKAYRAKIDFATGAADQLIAKLQRMQPANTAVSTQLALGNNQWVDLRVKIATLTRVGTDPTRTLANADGFEILVACQAPQPGFQPNPISVKYSDLQIYGGGGVDVGEVGDPIVYCYRYRSSATGAVSNPSPPSRGGVIPRRQDVQVVATPSGDPQVDKIDWFRFGGALTRYTYIGTSPNSADPFTDKYMDSAIGGGPTLSYDEFQPWPLADLPHTGTCNVAGTAVEWVSGDQFDQGWAAGSVILINGRATTLYASPSSATKLHVVDSVGAGANVQFSLPSPTLLSQPLEVVWGDYQGLWFACGDRINPGSLYWTNGNNIEALSDANVLLATTPSEPLMAGCMYNTFPFVASSEQLYEILVNKSDPVAPVRVVRTPCGRGFWTKWAYAVAPEGIYFLAADGIALSQGGAPAKIITTPDLRDIFPKDGQPGRSTNGIPAPDMTVITQLRLSYISGWLYFDYLGLDGHNYSLIFETSVGRFFLDTSAATSLTVRLEEPGAGVYNQIVGGGDGRVFQYEQAALSDAGAPIAWKVSSRWIDGGNPRIIKQFGDIGVSLNNGGNATGVTVQIVASDGSIMPAPATIAAGETARQTYIAAIPDGDLLADNLGIELSGVVNGDGRQTLFWWEPAYLLKAEDTDTRAADWDDLGYFGAKFIQGVIIRANTYGQTKQVLVQRATEAGEETMLALQVNHDGEAQIAYPLAADGWNPFIGELVRIKGGNDGVPWQLLSYRFVWEPAPELATQWETQFTSNEWPGYGHCRDMVIGYEATAPLTLRLTYDDREQVYVLPSTGGLYRRTYLVLCPGKGKAVRYKWTTPEPGRLYKRDITVRAQGWGLGGGYQTLSPFGGPSRADGAAI